VDTDDTITSRLDAQQIERQLQLLISLTQEIAASEDLTAAVELTLQRLCESAGWVFGEAWVPAADGTLLEYGAVWHGQSEALQRFHELSRPVRIAPGVGLAGRVWMSKRPEWVKDISATVNPRTELLIEAGLKGALAAPVLCDDQVLYVLLFFVREARDEELRLVELVSAVAGQLGAIIKQKQLEQELRRTRAALETRVQERTAELAQANRALQAEIAERGRMQEVINIHAQQQLAVARLGQLALSGKNLGELFDEASALVARTLGVEFCKILELISGGEKLLLRSGVGWKQGLVGTATVSCGFDSQAGYALLSAAPVVVEELRSEMRFKVSGLLDDHGVVSGISVIIPGRDNPFGVLGVHTKRRHVFDTDDTHFLEAVANVLSDAIERKKSEEEIQRRNSWLRSLIDTTQDAVLSIDREGRIVLFNPAAEQIFGFARAEVAGQKVNMLMGEPYRSEHDDYIARYERTNVPHAIGRIRTVTARRKSGELFPIELSVTKVAENEDVQYAAFIRDISEKAKLQAQLLESERLAAIGTTAAKIGHELSNPLNGMSLTIQLLESRIGQENREVEIGATLRRLKNEISRLNHLVGEFRTISRRERYDFRPTQLATLVEDIIKMEAPQFEKQRICVETRVPADIPSLNLDRDKIKQALLNLIKNAIEAMPEGGSLSIEAKKTSHGARLCIADTGVGIPLDVDAFEPFTTTKKGGTGLGLVIVRQIIVAHGGAISYHSRVGEGTTFEIELASLPSTRQQ
jgi:PAS domain S-box-containing protein